MPSPENRVNPESLLEQPAPARPGTTGASPGPPPRDFQLGVPGFWFRDLHDTHRLPDLLAAFDDYLSRSDADAFESLQRLRREPDRMGPIAVSAALVAAAPWVSRFVGRLFGIENELSAIESRTRAEDGAMRFRREFVQRRVAKAFGPNAKNRPPDLDSIKDADLLALLKQADPERALAEHVCGLIDRGADLGPAERLTAALMGQADANPASPYRHWVSLRRPAALEFDRLVQIIRPRADLQNLTMGPEAHRRRRDGFKLTDARMGFRDIMAETHYCIYCHERDKDSCTKGFPMPEGSASRYRANPLGVPLTGCPLDEKISEAHLMRSQGDPLAALALITVDNPMLPGTGHRICNDCMKACIYQKQEPVNIPQIETSILTEVLALPYGYEIYSFLTRFNPLHVLRPYALSYNGFNVLVVGMGPAGYTLAHHLANEGFAVVGIDGLKIEPLPADLTGADGLPPRPVRDVRELYRELDERPLSGFGGVSEYGITVRWDKNFLAVMQLNLARRRKVRMYGGIRFGGTLSVEQAWELGFDHVAIASGAGKPTIIEMKNNLIRGVRKASDFLMALQLTGAFKKRSLANLQVRLPAIVIGGGLTAIDTATELLAYYPVQVEKVLHRYETLASRHGEAAVRVDFKPEELEILDELLAHGRAVRSERARAASAREKPDFARLVQGWGGVTICYRKSMQDSPAYRLNHEEIIKALEEGIAFAENMEPLEAVPDATGYLKAMIFKRAGAGDSGATVELPARACMVAAGTSPNITYEKELPGTFQLDEKRRFFKSFVVEHQDGAASSLRPAARGETGFFTSYNRDGRMVSFFGDNHPRYAGNVVKAMASAKDGAPQIADLFAREIEAMSPDDLPSREARLERLWQFMDDEFRCRVVAVNRLTPTIIEVVVHAPQQARNFHPGQFYRLQNYEAEAQVIDGHPLLMEPLALTGAWVDRQRGLLSLIALELGASSRLCQRLKAGEPVIVMGPTGAPTEIVPGETVLLAGGGLGNAVLFSIAKGMREAGCRVIYFAGYKKPGDFFKRDDIEAGTDVVIYSVDSGEPIPARRPQDRTFVGNIVQAMLAWATGALGDQLIRLDECDRIIAIGSDVMMAAVTRARHGVLEPHLKPGHAAVASINSPMQCMMKEVCAQCLQKHIDPVTGETSVVFSCFNQDQPADRVDWAHLNARLKQNTVAEKLTSLWLERLLTVGDPQHIAR